MKATHIDYLHQRHVRVEDGSDVFCVAPSHSQYSTLTKRALPRFGDNPDDFSLPRNSNRWPK